MRFIIITGTSGAGKATAFNFFEDQGYFAVDNLPARLLPELAQAGRDQNCEKLLAVVDSRAGRSLEMLPDSLNALRKVGVAVDVVYLDASDETLVRRFKETRRPHPTFTTEQGTILAAIQAEREMLAEILPLADKVIDTSNFTPSELRAELARFAAEKARPGLIITVESFGFRHGLPIDADLVFDVRFLINPHYVPDLKPLTGQYTEVAQYIHRDPLTEPYLEKLFDFIAFSLPQYRREGKAYLTIAIGCTGGRHRSVMVAEELGAFLLREGYRAVVRHRDVARDPARYGEVSP